MTTTTYKLVLSLDQQSAERISAALSELYWPSPDAVGLFQNPDETWRVEAHFDEYPDEDALTAFLSAQDITQPDFAIEAIPQQDWVAQSQAGLHPIRAGRFLVHGSHDRHLAKASRWAIEIDAGQAFGTAHHGSTLGCLCAIDHLAKRRLPGKVLDVGTGTGVLAIACAKAGAQSVLASDIDPVAVGVANHNVRLNRANRCVIGICSDGFKAPLIRRGGRFDLIIANILARPLIGLAKEIARSIRPGGFVVLAGITNDQANLVSAAYSAAGFSRHRRLRVDEWTTLVMMRRL